MDFDKWMKGWEKPIRPKKRVRLHLNEAGENARSEFEETYGDPSQGHCYCAHTNPPCSACTHPGHPESIDASDEFWVYGEEDE